MQKMALAGTLALIGLAACSADSGNYSPMETGVGFGDYQHYLQQRETSRARVSAPYSVPPETRTAQTVLPPAAMPAAAPSTLDAVPVRYVPTPPPAPVATPVAAPAPLQPPLRAATPQPQPQPQPQIVGQPLRAPMTAPAPTITSHAPAAPAPAAAPAAAPSQGRPVQGASPSGSVRTVQASAAFGTTPAFDAGPSVRPGVSDEQDFQAVSARETIESDRERLAQQRAQYQVIEVASVPDASVSGGPNIVAFALGTTHAPGTEVYRRLNPLRNQTWQNNCLQFRNQDAAQEAFLSRGGPERDPDNLDPDGDGYACWWDPTPIRHAMAGASN